MSKKEPISETQLGREVHKWTVTESVRARAMEEGAMLLARSCPPGSEERHSWNLLASALRHVLVSLEVIGDALREEDER